MMRVEIELCQPDEFLLGLIMTSGEDDDGEFNMFSIGFLFFSINFIKYG